MIDCQYTDELSPAAEQAPSVGTVTAPAARLKLLVFNPHDPSHDDETITAKVEDAALRLSMLSPTGLVHGAREGMVIAVDQ